MYDDPKKVLRTGLTIAIGGSMLLLIASGGVWAMGEFVTEGLFTDAPSGTEPAAAPDQAVVPGINAGVIVGLVIAALLVAAMIGLLRYMLRSEKATRSAPVPAVAELSPEELRDRHLSAAGALRERQARHEQARLELERATAEHAAANMFQRAKMEVALSSARATFKRHPPVDGAAIARHEQKAAEMDALIRETADATKALREAEEARARRRAERATRRAAAKAARAAVKADRAEAKADRAAAKNPPALPQPTLKPIQIVTQDGPLPSKGDVQDDPQEGTR